MTPQGGQRYWCHRWPNGKKNGARITRSQMRALVQPNACFVVPPAKLSKRYGGWVALHTHARGYRVCVCVYMCMCVRAVCVCVCVCVLLQALLMGMQRVTYVFLLICCVCDNVLSRLLVALVEHKLATPKWLQEKGGKKEPKTIVNTRIHNARTHQGAQTQSLTHLLTLTLSHSCTHSHTHSLCERTWSSTNVPRNCISEYTS